MLFTCQPTVGYKPVTALGQINHHPIIFILKRTTRLCTRLHIVAILIIDIQRQAVYLLRECICIFHIIIVHKTH